MGVEDVGAEMAKPGDQSARHSAYADRRLIAVQYRNPGGEKRIGVNAQPSRAENSGTELFRWEVEREIAYHSFESTASQAGGDHRDTGRFPRSASQDPLRRR